MSVGKMKATKSVAKKFKKAQKLLRKNFNPKKLVPKKMRRAKTAHKVVKSIQKHQDTYLAGLRGISLAIGKFFK